MISNSYILASNCFIVDGYNRSILIDTQKGSFRILNKNQLNLFKKPIKKSHLRYLTIEEKKLFYELIADDILVNVPNSTLILFNKMNDQFFNSSLVNNLILELSILNLKKVNQITESINITGCKFVELRVEKEISLKELEHFIKNISQSTIQTIDIYFVYKNIKTYHELLKIKNKYLEVRWIYIFSCPEFYLNKMKGKTETGILLMKKGKMDKRNCGNVSPFYFTVNLSTYTESKHYNTCLNCKLSISGNGEIKHCPSMVENYGNIKSISLEKVIDNKFFTNYGKITKDYINTCKECEFRYICTDCRAYLENPKDIYSKPLKCGYNPYTNIWTDWRKDPDKQAAIAFYGL